MALAVINKCSAIINRLPAIIMVAIIDMALAIIDMASAIVNMLTVIHAMVTAININIDINTRRFCFFPPSGTGPAAGSGILGSGSLSAGICAKHYVAAGVSTFAFQGAGLPVLRWYPALALILVAHIKRLNRLRRRFVNKVRKIAAG